MIQWLLGLAADAGSTIAGVASAAQARILQVWNVITGFLVSVKGVVVGVRAAVVAWIAAHLLALVEVANTLQWLAFTYLPGRLGTLPATILSWAAQQIAQALAIAQSAITALRSWALAQLVAIAQAINALQLWAVSQFAQALARVFRLEGYVFGVLATPDRIAAYIVDSMARALGRWALANAVSVGRLFMRWWLANLTGALSIVEDVITRILFE